MIVLIITIIVVIILAVIVILTLSKNNPIESAKEARFKEDVRTFQDELAFAVSKEYTDNGGHRDTKISTSDFDEIKEYIPSFSKKYKEKLIIQDDELRYTKLLDEKEKEYAQKLNINKNKENFLPDEYKQVEYIESTGTQYIDTKIAGNSVNELYCGLDIVKMVNGNWANIMSANLDYLSLGTNERITSVYTRVNWNYNYAATISNGVCNDFIINKNNVMCNGEIVQTYNVDKLNGNSSGKIFLFNNNYYGRIKKEVFIYDK